MRDALDRLDAGLVAVNRWLVGLCMAVMTALVFANVVTRYLFGASIAWSEEISRFLMITIAFLGAGLALRQGRLIAVELFQDLLPPRLIRAVRIAVAAVILAFLAAIAALGIQYVRFNWTQITPVLQISAGIPYLAVPVGAVLMALHLLLGFRGFVERRWDAEPESGDDAEDAERRLGDLAGGGGGR